MRLKERRPWIVILILDRPMSYEPDAVAEVDRWRRKHGAKLLVVWVLADGGEPRR